MEIIVGFLVLFFLSGIIALLVRSLNKKAMSEFIAKLANFDASQQIINGNSGFAFDEQRKKVCLIENTYGTIKARVVNYKDLLSSEIHEDGQTIMRTSRSSQIGGAIVGGVLLGGVGAVIGGLSGKTVSADKVRRIEVLITVNDTAQPLHSLTFLDIETSKGGFVYNESIKHARHLHALIDVLIKQADADVK
ncbi:MAG: hypothetical protein WCJ56_12755 [bacterium]